MVDLVEAVEKGYDAKFYFVDPSLEEPLVFRPLTRREHEQSCLNALQDCENLKVQKLLFNWAFREDDEEVELTKQDYIDLRTYQYNLMLWICYYGLKDFQSPTFSIETLDKSFINIPKLATEILKSSIAKKEEVSILLKNREGKILLYTINVLGCPITDKAWKLTPLQFQFLTGRYKEMEADENYVETVKKMFDEL